MRARMSAARDPLLLRGNQRGDEPPDRPDRSSQALLLQTAHVHAPPRRACGYQRPSVRSHSSGGHPSTGTNARFRAGIPLLNVARKPLDELLLAEPAARQDRDERIPRGALVAVVERHLA